MLASVFEFLLIFLLLGSTYSLAQDFKRNTHPNNLNFFPSNKKLGSSDESKIASSKKVINSSHVSPDEETSSSEILHSELIKNVPLGNMSSTSNSLKKDHTNLIENNVDVKPPGFNIADVTSRRNATAQKILKKLSGKVKKNETKQTEVGENKKNRLPIDKKPMEATPEMDDADQQNDVTNENSNFAEESLLSDAPEEDLQDENNAMNVKQNSQDVEEANEKQLQEDNIDDLAKLPSSDSNDNLVDQTVDTTEENMEQKISSKDEPPEEDQSDEDKELSVPYDVDKNSFESKDEMDMTDSYDYDEKLSSDNSHKDTEELDVKKESSSLSSTEEQHTSKSGEITPEIIADENVEEASSDSVAVPDQDLALTAFPTELDEGSTTTLLSGTGHEKVSVLSSEPPPLSSTSSSVKVSSTSTLFGKITTTSSKPLLSSTEESQANNSSITTLQNGNTVPDSWLKNAEDYGKAVLDKYGTGQVVGIVVVVFFSLALFLCCMCRCRARGKYRRLRKSREYGKEKDLLLTDKKSKGVYHSDRLTLLDETSDDDL